MKKGPRTSNQNDAISTLKSTRDRSNDKALPIQYFVNLIEQKIISCVEVKIPHLNSYIHNLSSLRHKIISTGDLSVLNLEAEVNISQILCEIGDLGGLEYLSSINPSIIVTINQQIIEAFRSAIIQGHLNIIKFLHQHNTEIINCLDDQSVSMLHHAICYNKVEIAKYLIQYLKPEILLTQTKNACNTPLHVAVTVECLDSVKLILAHSKQNLNIPNVKNHTPLNLAIERGLVDITRTLLSHNFIMIDYSETTKNLMAIAEHLTKTTKNKIWTDIATQLLYKHFSNVYSKCDNNLNIEINLIADEICSLTPQEPQINFHIRLLLNYIISSDNLKPILTNCVKDRLNNQKLIIDNLENCKEIIVQRFKEVIFPPYMKIFIGDIIGLISHTENYVAEIENDILKLYSFPNFTYTIVGSLLLKLMDSPLLSNPDSGLIKELSYILCDNPELEQKFSNFVQSNTVAPEIQNKLDNFLHDYQNEKVLSLQLMLVQQQNYIKILCTKFKQEQDLLTMDLQGLIGENKLLLQSSIKYEEKIQTLEQQILLLKREILNISISESSEFSAEIPFNSLSGDS